MKKFNKRIKRFFRDLQIAIFWLVFYSVCMFLAILAICFLVSIPDIIGCLIFGF